MVTSEILALGEVAGILCYVSISHCPWPWAVPGVCITAQKFSS